MKTGTQDFVSFCLKSVPYYQTVMNKTNDIFHSSPMIWPHSSGFMLSPNLQYHTGHVFRAKTFSSSAVVKQPKLFPQKSLLTADHFKYEGSPQLGKAPGLIFPREEVGICVGGAPELVSKFVLQRSRVLPSLRG